VTAYLDTHVVIWLAQGDTGKLGAAARRIIDRNDLLISPAAVLELELLHEIGRLRTSAATLLAGLAAAIGLRICDLPFRAVVDHAIQEDWARDPFDRLIVANAKAAGAPLVTRDERIQKHYASAIW